MRFDELLELVGEQAVFSSSLLLAGKNNANEVERQLSRWVKTAQIYKLRKKLYSLAPPFQKIKPHPFLISNMLIQGSYVSNESALAFYNLIPEFPQVVTAIGICRPQSVNTPLGDFIFQHIKKPLFFGYQKLEVTTGQLVIIATKEKALLDLIYLRKESDKEVFLEELRLQNLGDLNPKVLKDFAVRFNSPKVMRAARQLFVLIGEEKEEYKLV